MRFLLPTPARDPYVETRYVDPDELRPYPGNPNSGDVDAIRGSVRRNGQYRPVIARRLPDGALEILAGHATTEATGAEAGRVRIEVIDVDDATARRIVAADNAIPQRATMDEAALLALLDEAQADGGLDGTGFDDVGLRDLLDRAAGGASGPGLDGLTGSEAGDGSSGSGGTAYTTAVNIPQYEPVGPPPPVAALRDETRAGQLRDRILATPGLPDDVRDYLLAAASRHIVFNYRAAAEFYPHASPDVQALMEESALIIIDLDDAIRLGYARLSSTLEEARDLDADGDDGEDDDSDGE